MKNNLIKLSRFILLTLLLFILPPRIVLADTFEQLRRNSADIKTVQARFVQKKLMKILAKPLISEGRFFYASPDSFRWEYLKPLRSVVLSGKGVTKRYIMSGGKMAEDKSGGVKAMGIVLGEITNWMSGKFDQNPSFKTALHEGRNTLITLTPVEQNMAGMIEKIEISVVRKTMVVKSVKIIEDKNTATVINFSNVEMNKGINASIFQDVE